MPDEQLTQELPAVERPIYVKCLQCKARLDEVGSADGELCLDCEANDAFSSFVNKHFQPLGDSE